jgi:hypothetical protein
VLVGEGRVSFRDVSSRCALSKMDNKSFDITDSGSPITFGNMRELGVRSPYTERYL